MLSTIISGMEQGPTVIQAQGIGNLAAEKLTHIHDYIVRGNTSRGLFLESQGDTMIFLSYEKYCGPFTVNLPNEANGLLADIEPGEFVKGSGFRDLVIDSFGLRIDTIRINPWEPAPYDGMVTRKVIKSNTTELAQWARENAQVNLMLSLALAQLTGDVHTEEGNKVMRYLKDLVFAFKRKDQGHFLQSAIHLVGLGSGLTPSGDDLLTGINLAVNRYSPVYPGLSFYQPWMRELGKTIRERTTMISSSLFQAALHGLADERLINAFDEMMSDRMQLEGVVGALRTWGSSSGFDSLAGVMLLLNTGFLEGE